MVMIPRKYLQAVVMLGDYEEGVRFGEWGQILRPAGTGFLYGHPASRSPEDRFRLWLVTCAHVLDSIRESGQDSILIRMNKMAHESTYMWKAPTHDDDSMGWFFHPREDVAVLRSSPSDLESKGIDWEIFAAGRNTLPRSEAIDVRLSEGDEVFFTGFPIGWREGKRDYPVVRQGVLAQVQGWLRGEHETFLVDGSGFGGNSGGPVILKPQAFAIEGTGLVAEPYLIGMVSGRVPAPIRMYDEVPSELEVFYKTIIELGLTESADLVDVIPVDVIDETIRLAMEAEVG